MLHMRYGLSRPALNNMCIDLFRKTLIILVMLYTVSLLTSVFARTTGYKNPSYGIFT
jgi:hypothetical protein